MFRAQTSTIGQCVLDIDRRIWTVDGAFLRFLGRERYDVTGRPEVDFTHHDDRQLTGDRLAELDKNGGSVAITKRYVRSDDTVIWVTNHIRMDESAVDQRRFAITSSLCDPVISDAVVANWRIANHIVSGFAAGKAIFGSDLFCATPVEAMLLLYMAESDGRSLTLEDVSAQAQIATPAMARWITALADRDLIEIVQHSPLPAATVLRITATCFGMLDKLIRKNLS